MATTEVEGQLMGLTRFHLLDKTTKTNEVVLTNEETNHYYEETGVIQYSK